MMNDGVSRSIGIGIVAVIAADWSTKLAASAFSSGSRSGWIVPVRNPELSLGTATGPLVAMLLLATVAVAVAARCTIGPARRGELPTWIPVCIVGGALANIGDRAVFGAVHDFIATPLIIMNLADLAVVAGLAGLVVYRNTLPRKEVAR